MDLRTQGIETPVKMQDPWVSCWSFGVIAAAESSILHDAGTTFAETGFDLSERHLNFFARHPIDESIDPNQAGEGIRIFEEETGNPNASFSVGGSPILASTLFSTGVGPVSEADFPYRGNAGFTTYEFMRDHKDQWVRAFRLVFENENDREPTDGFHTNRSV